MDLNIDDYQLNKTNIYGDPCKAIKNENQFVSNCLLKDSELIFLKNISEEINEDYSISLYKGNDFEMGDCNDSNNFSDKICLTFVNDDNDEIKNPKSFVFYEIPEKNLLLNFSVSYKNIEFYLLAAVCS